MPISVAYSLMSADHARIKAIAELTEPGLVFADDAGAVRRRPRRAAPRCSRVLVARGEREGALRLDDLLAAAPRATRPTLPASPGPTPWPSCCSPRARPASPRASSTPIGCCAPTRRCSRRSGRSWPTSRRCWSTGCPGATPSAPTTTSTWRCSTAARSTSTTAPAPPLFPRTLAALKDVPPTLYFNVPAGYALLAPALESDAELAERFFSRLRFMFYAAAALPDALAARLRALAAEHADHEVPLTSSWGTTETAPAAPPACTTSAPPPAASACRSGLHDQARAGRRQARDPGQGAERHARLLPPARADADTFDEDGFYRSGDAVRLIDDRRPEPGHAVRRAHRRELQAAHRHVGGGGRAAHPADQRRRRAETPSSAARTPSTWRPWPGSTRPRRGS